MGKNIFKIAANPETLSKNRKIAYSLFELYSSESEIDVSDLVDGNGSDKADADMNVDDKAELEEKISEQEGGEESYLKPEVYQEESDKDIQKEADQHQDEGAVHEEIPFISKKQKKKNKNKKKATSATTTTPSTTADKSVKSSSLSSSVVTPASPYSSLRLLLLLFIQYVFVIS